MGRLGGFWKGVLWVKGSILVGLAGAFIAYENHDEAKQVEYNIFDKKQPIENNYFVDPPGLNVQWRPNEEGKIETFLQYKSNSEVVKEIGIMEDMLPSNDKILDGLESRFDLDGVLFDFKKNKDGENELYMILKDSSGTYEKKVDKSLFADQQGSYRKAQDSPVGALFKIMTEFYGGKQNGNN